MNIGEPGERRHWDIKTREECGHGKERIRHKDEFVRRSPRSSRALRECAPRRCTRVFRRRPDSVCIVQFAFGWIDENGIRFVDPLELLAWIYAIGMCCRMPVWVRFQSSLFVRLANLRSEVGIWMLCFRMRMTNEGYGTCTHSHPLWHRA